MIDFNLVIRIEIPGKEKGRIFHFSSLPVFCIYHRYDGIRIFTVPTSVVFKADLDGPDETIGNIHVIGLTQKSNLCLFKSIQILHKIWIRTPRKIMHIFTVVAQSFPSVSELILFDTDSRRAHDIFLRNRDGHIVDAEIRVKLAVAVVLMADPMSTLIHTNLRKPLRHTKEVFLIS